LDLTPHPRCQSPPGLLITFFVGDPQKNLHLADVDGWGVDPTDNFSRHFSVLTRQNMAHFEMVSSSKCGELQQMWSSFHDAQFGEAIQLGRLS